MRIYPCISFACAIFCLPWRFETMHVHFDLTSLPFASLLRQVAIVKQWVQAKPDLMYLRLKMAAMGDNLGRFEITEFRRDLVMN